MHSLGRKNYLYVYNTKKENDQNAMYYALHDQKIARGI